MSAVSSRWFFKYPNLIFGFSNSAPNVFTTLAAAEMSFGPVTTASCPASDAPKSTKPVSLTASRNSEFFTTCISAPAFTRRLRSSVIGPTFRPR